MKNAALAAVGILVSTVALANPSVPDPGILGNPDVLRAAHAAWKESACGVLDFEAAFRLDGNPVAFRVVAAATTNASRQQTLSIVAGGTFAVFHVHPNRTQAEPSQHDRIVADRYQFKIYTIHVRGLYEYDPATRRVTKLRNGVEWMQPAQR